MKKEDVYLHCLERWSSADKRISYFEENFDEWFSQLPEDIHEVVCQLLEMFEYYSQLKVNQYLCDLGFKLDEKEQFNPDATIYTPLPSHKGIANSSYDYLFTYRQLHDVSKYKIALDLDRYIEEKPDKLPCFFRHVDLAQVGMQFGRQPLNADEPHERCRSVEPAEWFVRDEIDMSFAHCPQCFPAVFTEKTFLQGRMVH